MTSELDSDEAPADGARHHYGHFGLDRPDDAAAASATRIGDGDGVHEVYLHVESEEPVPVDIEILADSEAAYRESVELGIGRYAFYEFTYEADYRITATVDGNEAELDVSEEWIGATSGRRPRRSYQLFLIGPDGETDEIGVIDD